MAINVKNSGVWRDVSGLSVKSGGVWRGSTGYVKSGGVWRDVGPSSGTTWDGITNPENQISWGTSTTLNNPQQLILSWPAGQDYFKAQIYGAGGGRSNGGRGAAGGYATLYLAKPSAEGLVLVVGHGGHYGTPGGPNTRQCSGKGNCTFATYGNQTNREMGGRPGTGRSPHNWGSTGGGFSGVFINDNNTTSAQGYKYWFCTPVAIAGGGGGGQAYNSTAREGGGYSIARSVHYQSPPAAFNSSNVVDINFVSQYGIDGQSECYSDCALGLSYPQHPYLRNNDGNTAGGFASGSNCQGGTGFIYGEDNIDLTSIAGGFDRNAATLQTLNNANHVHVNSAHANGGGMGVETNGRMIYQFGS